MTDQGTAPTTSPATKASVERVQTILEPLPKLKSKVVHGFGRGSKMLGFPTANMEVKWNLEKEPDKLTPEEKDILNFAQSCEAGIYYAWAQVVDGADQGIYKAAMSVGWNPTFTDVKAKTVEPWILHEFPEDFYDCELRLAVCGFVRKELKFDNFDDLIVAIREDGDFCSAALDEASCQALVSDSFFKSAT
jgi:riboflavin kinase